MQKEEEPNVEPDIHRTHRETDHYRMASSLDAEVLCNPNNPASQEEVNEVSVPDLLPHFVGKGLVFSKD